MSRRFKVYAAERHEWDENGNPVNHVRKSAWDWFGGLNCYRDLKKSGPGVVTFKIEYWKMAEVGKNPPKKYLEEKNHYYILSSKTLYSKEVLK